MKQNIIDVEINANAPVLSRLGASEADFADALHDALESLANSPHSVRPRPADIPLLLCGQQQRLGDVAAIRVRLG